MSENENFPITAWGFKCRTKDCPNDSREDSYYCREHEGTQGDV